MKLGYTTLLFDLDGTLTDSAEGILNCVRLALDTLGITETDQKRLFSFIGPPLSESFKRLYGIEGEPAKKALRVFREHYEQSGKLENRVYDGIPKLLQNLKNANYRLILATAKPEIFSASIMEHFELDCYFDFMYGCNEKIKRINKADVIRDLIAAHPDITRENTIMIGDRDHDVLGAAQNGLDCIGVLYGFGDREELQNAGAKYIVETVNELQELLI